MLALAEIATRLKEYRRERGLKWNWIAKQAKIGPCQMSRIVAERHYPVPDKIARLEKATGTTLHEEGA